jgi:hypothetical protein
MKLLAAPLDGRKTTVPLHRLRISVHDFAPQPILSRSDPE